MRRRFLPCIALVLLACTAPTVVGCGAGLGQIVQTVADVVSLITGKLELVESHVQAATESGLLPPEVADKAAKIRALLERIRDGAEASPAVVAEFERLWNELLAASAPHGVVQRPPDSRLGAPAPGTVQVPPAAELGARLRESGR